MRHLSDGGKNVKPLRNTEWAGQEQLMQKPDGTQKGIKTILSERGLWREQPRMQLECMACVAGAPPPDNEACCARRALSNCPDFAGSQCWLEEVVEEAGCKMIFLNKFHHELNFIEMVWAHIKADLLRKMLLHFCRFASEASSFNR